MSRFIFKQDNKKVLKSEKYIALVKDGMHPKLAYYGTYYGYPDCCIKFFDTRLDGNMALTLSQNMVHENKGFIPCAKCADKVVNKEVTLKELIKDRIYEREFPIDEMDA